MDNRMKNLKENVQNLPDRAKGYAFYGLLLIVLGIFIIIGHNMALDIICKVVGLMMLLSAAGGLVFCFRHWHERTPELFANVTGTVIALILGLWCVFGTDSFVSLLNILLGVSMIVAGATGMVQGGRGERDILSMILSAICIVLGFIVCFTHVGTSWLTIMMGISLIFTGISSLVTTGRNN